MKYASDSNCDKRKEGRKRRKKKRGRSEGEETKGRTGEGRSPHHGTENSLTRGRRLAAGVAHRRSVLLHHVPVLCQYRQA